MEVFALLDAVRFYIVEAVDELLVGLFQRIVRGVASKYGILFKGGIVLEALKKIKAVVMDKTWWKPLPNYHCLRSLHPDW